MSEKDPVNFVSEFYSMPRDAEMALLDTAVIVNNTNHGHLFHSPTSNQGKPRLISDQ